jgi:hypothetical protein
MYKVKHPLRCVVLVAISLAVVGCEKIGSASSAPETAVIPASFGDLVAVTPTDRPVGSVLWFKQPDQTIVAVYVDTTRGAFLPYKTKYARR